MQIEEALSLYKMAVIEYFNEYSSSLISLELH